MKPMNIAVVGLGALGITFATLLKKSGHRVLGITKEKYVPALSGRPLKVSGIWGNHQAVLDGIFSDAASLEKEQIDLIVLTVKSFDTEQTARQLTPLVGPNTIVMAAQNGYGNYETLAKIVGKEHSLLARIIFGARVIEAGASEVTVIADDVRIGQPDGAIPEDVIINIAAVINEAGIPTQYAPEVNAILWDKIIYNCALNPLGALLECSYGDLADHEGSRQVMNEVIREIFAVAAAHGIALRWKSADEYMDVFYNKLVPPTRAHFPSMYHDLKAGKRLEIDSLNGAIVRLGSDRGIPVPVNETVTRLTRAKEEMSLQKV